MLLSWSRCGRCLQQTNIHLLMSDIVAKLNTLDITLEVAISVFSGLFLVCLVLGELTLLGCFFSSMNTTNDCAVGVSKGLDFLWN